MIAVIDLLEKDCGHEKECERERDCEPPKHPEALEDCTTTHIVGAYALPGHCKNAPMSVPPPLALPLAVGASML